MVRPVIAKATVLILRESGSGCGGRFFTNGEVGWYHEFKPRPEYRDEVFLFCPKQLIYCPNTLHRKLQPEKEPINDWRRKQ